MDNKLLSASQSLDCFDYSPFLLASARLVLITPIDIGVEKWLVSTGSKSERENLISVKL